MSEVSRVGKIINRAIEEVNAEIMNRALAAVPRSASIGEIIAEFEAADFKEELEGLSLRDFLAAVGAKPGKRGPGRPRVAARKEEAAAEGTKSRSRNTRTASGREALVRDTFAALSKLGGEASAEKVRAEVGGHAGQIRKAMQTLMEQGLVKRKGEKRSTMYSLSE